MCTLLLLRYQHLLTDWHVERSYHNKPRANNHRQHRKNESGKHWTIGYNSKKYEKINRKKKHGRPFKAIYSYILVPFLFRQQKQEKKKVKFNSPLSVSLAAHSKIINMTLISLMAYALRQCDCCWKEIISCSKPIRVGQRIRWYTYLPLSH